MTNKSFAPYGAQTSVPTVNITVNNNRLKRYNKQNPTPNYYLNNGQEFQLELFNPTQYIVRADISLNNVKIKGGGLVLKPGERVFLDRYLDSPRKFKFETYEVGNSKEVKKAIEKNGLVKVQFYQQDLTQGFFGGTIITTTPNYYPWSQHNTPINTFYTNSGTSSGNIYGPTCTTTNGDFSTTSLSGNVTNTMAGLDSLHINTLGNVGLGNTNPQHNLDVASNKQLLCDSPDILRGHLSKGGSTNSPATRGSKKMETGMVGKGSTSNQSFKYVDYQFLPNVFHTIEYQILPLSTKQITTSDLNVKRYCTECGTKYSKGSKYCSQCGNKL
jgi:hypothetical protein